MTWQIYALLAAVAAGATAVLTKIGAAGVPPTTVVAIRTAIVFGFVVVVTLIGGEHRSWSRLSIRTLTFLTLSAVATGLSWIAYVRALQLGPVSGVAAIDKLGLTFAAVFAVIWLGEPLTWRLAVGVTLMVAGAVLMIRP
jgi:transporter family protein